MTGAAVLPDIPKRVRHHFSRRSWEVRGVVAREERRIALLVEDLGRAEVIGLARAAGGWAAKLAISAPC
jgi:hypothetical protein